MKSDLNTQFVPVAVAVPMQVIYSPALHSSTCHYLNSHNIFTSSETYSEQCTPAVAHSHFLTLLATPTFFSLLFCPFSFTLHSGLFNLDCLLKFGLNFKTITIFNDNNSFFLYLSWLQIPWYRCQPTYFGFSIYNAFVLLQDYTCMFLNFFPCIPVFPCTDR